MRSAAITDRELIRGSRRGGNLRRAVLVSAFAAMLVATPLQPVAAADEPTADAEDPTIVNQPWDQVEPWEISGPGSGSITDSGELLLGGGESDDVTRATLNDVDVPEAYSVATTVRVEEFGSENGMAVYDGDYRLMLYFTEEGIGVRNITSEELKVVRWSSDTDTHDLRVDVVDGQARLYLDSVDRGSFALQASSNAERMEYWVAGPDAATFAIDHTALSHYAPPTEPQEVLNDGLASIDEWALDGEGSATPRGNGTHLRGDIVATRNLEIPDRYTVSWQQRTLKPGDTQTVSVGNGKQRLELRTDADGAHLRDQDDNWRLAMPSSDTHGDWQEVTVTVDKGFAQLVIDGAAPSAVIPLWRSDQAPGIELSLTGRGALVVIDDLQINDVGTEPSTFAAYSEDFEDETAGAFQESAPDDDHTFTPGTWSNSVDGDNHTYHAALTDEPALALLPALGRDVSFDFRVRASDVSENGELSVFARRSADTSFLAAVYDVDTQQWSLQEQEYQDVPVEQRATSEPTPLGTDWVDVRLEATRNRAELYVGNLDEPLLTADNIHRRGLGNVGWQTRGIAIDVDDVAYQGENEPTPGIRAMSGFDYDNASNILRLSNGYLTMPGAEGVVWESQDDGQTWVPIDREDKYEYLQALAVVLDDGTIVSMQHVAGEEENTFQYRAWRSEDDGQTWQGPFDVNEEWKNRITMGGKLTETESGRIFFPSGESGHAEEEFGGVWIYYSDDGGQTWNESETRLDWDSFGVNLQETSIIELSDGRLKAISRSDGGFMMESVSADGGVTWSDPVNIPGLRTSLCAFSLDRDPETGDIYLFWEYTDPDDSMTAPQMPRNRASLAVSRDDTETWEFLADIDDFMVDGDEDNHHMNQSLTFDAGQLWLTAARQDKGGNFGLYAWQVGPDALSGGGPLPGVHDLISYR